MSTSVSSHREPFTQSLRDLKEVVERELKWREHHATWRTLDTLDNHMKHLHELARVERQIEEGEQ